MSEPRKTAKEMMEKGLVVVYTGDGKGKTTAALGMICRSLGHGYKVALIQFINQQHGRNGIVVFNRLKQRTTNQKLRTEYIL